jgi:heme/copper-type cytochrome/quinol oxidase subunit 2
MRPITVPSVVIAIVITVTVLRPSPSRADPIHEVQVVASKFAFEPAVIQVTAGEAVRLVIRSADAVHGFAIRDLKLDAQIPRHGDAVTIEFVAPPAGRHQIACSEFCGSGHKHMKGVLVSVTATTAAR